MSLRLAALNLFLRRLVRPRLARVTDPQLARREFARAARLMLPKARGVAVTTVPASVRMVQFLPNSVGERGAILYFHGGGYVVGSARTHAGLIGLLARRTGLPVFAPDYRLAPEHPFPAAWQDARAAWRNLREMGFEGRQIVLGGDSAGGGLALSLLADLCAAGNPPAALFAYSPWTDLTGRNPSYRLNADRDVLLPVERLDYLTSLVMADHARDDPRASPFQAEFPNCPPLLLFASEDETPRDDSVLLARRLAAEGVRVDLSLEPHRPHAWPVFARLPESKAAIRRTASFARAALGLRPLPEGSDGS